MTAVKEMETHIFPEISSIQPSALMAAMLFSSDASNLVANDTNSTQDVFVYDSVSHTIERVSVASDGTQGDGASFEATISADGRYVAYVSSASNLVPGAPPSFNNFVYDRLTHTTELIPGPIDSYNNLTISADGRYVAFNSLDDGVTGLSVYDRVTHATSLVTNDPDGPSVSPI